MTVCLLRHTSKGCPGATPCGAPQLTASQSRIFGEIQTHHNALQKAEPYSEAWHNARTHWTARQLATATGLHISTVRKHTATLKDGQYLRRTIIGGTKLYSLNIWRPASTYVPPAFTAALASPLPALAPLPGAETPRPRGWPDAVEARRVAHIKAATRRDGDWATL